MWMGIVTFSTIEIFILLWCEAGQTVSIIAENANWMVGPDITSTSGWIYSERTHLPTPPRMGYLYWDGSAWQGDDQLLFTFDEN